MTLRSQGGGVTVEVAVLTPVLALLMLFVVFSGRLAQADQDLSQAVAEAARAVSMQRTGDAARLARDVVADNLAASGVRCRDLATLVDGSTVAGSTVRVTAHCDIDLSGVAALGLPRSRRMSASATQVVDVYRGDR